MALRFLLDQNSPRPILDVAAVDATVEYVALREFDSALTEGGTPDWLIYLRAAESGEFDGIVTRDLSQLDDAEELVALNDTGLTVITWQRPVEDSIQEWANSWPSCPSSVFASRRIDRLSFFCPSRRSGRTTTSESRMPCWVSWRRQSGARLVKLEGRLVSS